MKIVVIAANKSISSEIPEHQAGHVLTRIIGILSAASTQASTQASPGSLLIGGKARGMGKQTTTQRSTPAGKPEQGHAAHRHTVAPT
ncbi:hypothetical protein AAFA46_08420 [Oscillospiraceae bacterium WX1]